MNLNEVKKFKEEFSNLVKIANDENYYCDINLFKSFETRINVDKVNTDIGKDCDFGIKIRLWDGEKFLENGTSQNDFESLKNIVLKLVEKANKNNSSNDFKKIELDIDEEKISKDFLKDDINLGLKEKVLKLKDFRKKVDKLSSKIINSRVVLVDKIEENIFVNKYKSLYQKIPVKIFAMVGVVSCEDKVNRDVYSSFANNNYEILDKAENNLEDFKNKVENIYSAKKLEGGKYKVVLSPTLTGLLAHESFGHGMEADTMMKDRALASSWIGRKIGSSKINIVDYPMVEGKNGTFYFDHEGNLARKTYLVKDGIINIPMADIYSKTKLHLRYSGNSRFESFDHKNYVRMSNTYFEAGDEDYKDLISRVDDGIFILTSGGGMEDPNGWGVQIQGNFGQRIKNGKLVNEFYDGFTLTGFLPDIIKNVSGISKDFEMDGAGSCGKGHKEWVRVSEGGPYLLIDEVTLG